VNERTDPVSGFHSPFHRRREIKGSGFSGKKNKIEKGARKFV
jgi:hypothetical protein